jgi:hypothetical protein
MRYKRVLRDPARLCHTVELAFRRLTITPEQLWKELEADDELADLESGAVSVKSTTGSRHDTSRYVGTKNPAVAGFVETKVSGFT